MLAVRATGGDGAPANGDGASWIFGMLSACATTASRHHCGTTPVPLSVPVSPLKRGGDPAAAIMSAVTPGLYLNSTAG